MIVRKRQILVWIYCCINIMATAQIIDTVEHRSQDSSVIPQNFMRAGDDSSIIIIADITIRGNKRTRPFIVDREIPFKQGDYMPGSQLDKKLILAQQQLMNTSLFTSVTVYIHSLQGGLAFINIDVKERWYFFPLPYFKLVDRNFNQWWVEQKASLNRVNYGIKFQQNNVSGRNDKLGINLITGYSRQVQLKYEQPYAFNSLKSGYSIAFSYANQRELNYATEYSKQVFYKQDKFVLQSLRAEAAYLYRPAIRTRHTFRVGYTRNEVSDTVVKLNPFYYPNGKNKVAYPEFSYTVQYANTDYNPYPTKGIIWDLSLIRKGLNKDVDLTQLQYHINYAMPVSQKINLTLQSAGILKVPFDQPYTNQQLFGYGDAFMRGLEYYVTDGVAGIMGRATIRTQLFSTILKTPPGSKKDISIPFRLYLKAGVDGGYTYSRNPGNSLLNNKFLYTEMFGADMVFVNYDIVFRFEYSFNQLGESGLFFHVRTDF